MGLSKWWRRLRSETHERRRWLSDECWHDTLEPRILLDATPAVVVSDAQGSEMIGEQVSFDLNFTNTGSADSGFLPFVDLIVPTNGEDGAAGSSIPDGLTLADATFLGGSMNPTTIAVDGTGSVTHPFATDASGAPLVVTGLTPGDTFVSFQFPFGSVAPGQSFDAVLSFDISELADPGAPLLFEVRGGFALGEDALDNPGDDPPIIPSFAPGGSVSPTILQVTKSSLAPETETATGPNFVRQFELKVDLADGQTVTDLTLQDFLGPDLVFLGVDSITAPTGTTATQLDTPVLGQPNTQPDNDLVVHFDSVTGTGAADEIAVRFSYYVTDQAADASSVLDPQTGDETTTVNPTSDPTPPPAPLVSGLWSPLDSRDSETLVSDTDSAQIIQRSIAIQKSVLNVVDPQGTGASSGDVLEYTLQLQISDYFSFGDLVVTDSLGDGQSFDTSFTPTLSFAEHGFSVGSLDLLAGEFAAGPDDALGIETISFELSQAVARISGEDGVLEGGLVNGSFGPTTATLVFRAVIDSAFVDPPPGANPSVSQGDVLSNAVTVAGTVRENANLSNVVGVEDDASGASVAVARGSLSKELYAVNGVVGADGTNVEAGDTITYRLTYQLPLTEFENFSIVDYLPQPVLDALELSAPFDTAGGAAVPLAGSAKFGPADTFFTTTGIAPSLATDGTTNTVTFGMGTFDSATDTSSTLDVLFSVSIQDAEFADQLQLTNQANASEDSTNNGSANSTEIAQITLAAPDLQVRKGVVATDNPGGSFNGAVAPSGISFSAPGSAGAHFSGGSITSSNLGTTLDADVEGIDAGDLVKFAIVLENTGADDAFDVRIQDMLPVGFAIPAAGPGLNLQVTDGGGNAIGLEAGADLFGAGIELTDINPGADVGAIDDVNGTAGTNIIVISYDLLVEDTVQAEAVLLGEAAVDQFAAAEGGMDRSADPADAASAEIAAPAVTKLAISTSFSGTGSGQGSGSRPDLTVGESVTFEVRAVLSEGSYPTLQLVDALPVSASGGVLEFISGTITSVGAGVLPSSSLITSSDSDGDGRDDRVVFDFGATTVTGDNAANNTITVEITARVVDDPANAGVETLTNTARLVYPNGSVQATGSIDMVEPVLQVAKVADVASGDAGDSVQYEVTLTHGASSSADAFDLVLTDLLVSESPGISLDPTSVVVTSSGASNVVLTNGGGPLQVTADRLDLGGNIQIRYRGTIDSGIGPNASLTNAADVNWSSLPSGDAGEAHERVGMHADSHTVVTREPTLGKAIVATSLAETGSGEHTGAPDLSVGEEMSFEITIRVPEGSTPLVVTEDLPTSLGVLSVVSSTVVSIGGNTVPGATSGGNLSGSSLAVGGSGLDSDSNLVDGIADRVVFDFGTVSNTADGVADALDEIVVRVVARVEDVPANVDGDALVATASVDFGSGSSQETSVVDLVEPLLQLQKSLVGGPSPSPGDAGAIYTFELTIDHATGSSAEAFDLVIHDALIPELALVDGSVTLTGGTGATVSSGNGAGDTEVRVEVDSLDTGGLLRITFQAVVADAALPTATYENTATLDWDSHPDPGTGRSGVQQRDTTEITTPDPTFDKQIVATSVPETGSGQFGPEIDLAVGELVTFQLTATLPEGTTTLALADDLPTTNGILEVVSSRVVSIGGNTTPGASAGGGLSVSGLAVGDAGVASDSNLVDSLADRVVFDFGSVVNQGNNLAADDTIVAEVVARVVDVPANAAGDALSATGTLEYNGGSGPAQLADAENVELVEPLLELEKVADRTDVVGGEIVTYTVVISHAATSSAAAYDLGVSDVLSDPLASLVVGSVTASAGSVAIGNSPGDSEIRVEAPVLDLGDSLTVSYRVEIAAGAPLATTISNDASLDWDSVPGAGGRADADAASEQIRTQPDLRQLLQSSSVPNSLGSELHVGEQVTYRLTVTLGEGETRVVLADELPDVFQVLSSRVVSIGGNTSIGATAGGGISGSDLAVGAAGVASDVNFADGQPDRVAFDLGTLTNAFDGVVDAGDEILIEVVGVVADVPQNADGNIDSNVAVLDFGSDTKQASLDTTLIEPILQIDKLSSSTRGDAGDTLDFTLRIDHNAASSADAFDLLIEDLVADANLALVDGSVSVVSAPGTSVVSIQAGNAGEGFLRVGVDQIVQGEQIEVAYRAQVLAGASPEEVIQNTATLDWDSLPGAGGRVQADLDSETFVVDGPSLALFVSDSSDPFSESDEFDPAVPDLFPGELVTFDVVLTIPEGTSPTVVLTDLLPAGLSYVSSELVFIGGNLVLAPGAPALGDSGVVTDGDGDGRDDTIVFDLTQGGSLVNISDQERTSDDEIRVRVVAEAPDVEPGSVLRNTARFDFGSGTLTEPADVEIAQPFAFDTLHSFGAMLGVRFGESGQAMRGDTALDRPVQPLLPLDPIYSGTAQPGSTLQLTVLDARGQPIAQRSAVVDAGGNWQLSFPSASLSQHSIERGSGGRLEGARLFRASAGVLEADSGLLGFRPDASVASQGAVLHDVPHTVRVEQVGPSFHAGADRGPSDRTYFTPPVNQGLYIESPLSVAKVMTERAGHGVEVMKRAAEEPLGFGWNQFTSEFLTSPGSPAGR